MQRNFRLSSTTIVFFLIGTSLSLITCSAQKTTVRPYQFAFEIEEQQHRSERRDENGIVMGEFGFITADGIYHVTVYATDEEGRFKILSMKNYPYSKRQKIMQMITSPILTSMITTARSILMKKPTIKITATTRTTTTTTTTKAPPRSSFGAKACAGCSFLTPKSKNNNRAEAQPGESIDDHGGIDLRFGGNSYELGTEYLVKPKIGNEAHENTIHTKHMKTPSIELNKSVHFGFNKKDFELGTEFLDNDNHNSNLPSLLKEVFASIQDPIDADRSVQKLPDTSSDNIAHNNMQPRTKAYKHNSLKTFLDTPSQDPKTDRIYGNSYHNKGIDSVEHSRTIRDTQTRYNTNIKSEKPQPARNPNLNLIPTSKRIQVTTRAQQEGGSGAKSKITISTGKRLPVNDMRLLSRKLVTIAPSAGKVAATNAAENDMKITNSKSTTASRKSEGTVAYSEGDLYRFKYLLNYNGHSETGKRNGNKVGKFHTISNDDVKHSIEYIANEFGYQPHVKVDRGIASVPSKDNSLKEYEFIWFKKE